MFLLFYLVALFGVTVGKLTKEQLVQLAIKCKEVQGLTPDQAQAKGLTVKQLQACPKILAKVEQAKAKKQAAATTGAPQNPQQPQQPANPSQPANAVAAKQQRIANAIKTCKEKKDELSDAAKAKCEKLLQKISDEQSADEKLKKAKQQLEQAKELNQQAADAQSASTQKVDSKKVTDDFKKGEKKSKKLEEKIKQEDDERLDSGCFKGNVFYASEDLYYFKNVDSSFKCQLKCGKLDGCEFFSWFNKDGIRKGKPVPKLCLLKAKKPDEDTRRQNVISGPKRCGKGTQNEFEEGNDRTEHLPLSFILFTLSFLFAIFAFALVVFYTRKKETNCSDNSSVF